MSNFNEVLEFTDMHLQNMKQMACILSRCSVRGSRRDVSSLSIYLDLDVCEICLQKQRGVLHKYNIKHVKTLDLAFQSSIDFQKWDFARTLALELVDAY